MAFTLLYLAADRAGAAVDAARRVRRQRGWGVLWDTIRDPRVVASYRLTLGTSFVAACVNAVFGLVVAWVLVRYEFPGRRLVDALIDLPFALPTAVAGITLTSAVRAERLARAVPRPLGIKVAFTPLGITIALVFIGLPFVVRTLQPVIADLDVELEEVATSLGANRRQVIFRVILPYLYPAWLTGFALAFARAVGEYGSVVFISGNMPMRTEIASLLIITKLSSTTTPARRRSRCCCSSLVRAAARHQRAPGLEHATAGLLMATTNSRVRPARD